MTHPFDTPAPAVVLDTNVVLAWLLFADPAVAGLAHRIEAGALRWLACARMRDELADVLGRPPFAERGTACEQALASFDRHVTLVSQDIAPAAAPGLRCADPDDQVFADLALAHGARWLYTRDKALLALAPAARRHGVEIVAPAPVPAERLDLP
jgi:predicted nucleic acid-binding protein